jgi:hypothetical protein
MLLAFARRGIAIVSGEHLRFGRFLTEQTNLAYGLGWKGTVEKHVMDRAHTTHSLQVMDALSDTVALPIRVSESLTEKENAFQHLRYGASRRLLMMWYAYRNVVVYSAPPGRLKPLSTDESIELTRDLNVIYLNIRGTLDNLAWALLHEYAPEKTKTRPSQIGLFNSCLTKDERFKRLSPVLNEHREWNLDLKTRRDPAAHRIPLTIPPQALTDEDRKTYVIHFKDFDRAAQALDFARADEAFKQTELVGQFFPYFIHDVDERPIPIYPTLPEDLAHTVEICREVGRFFSPVSKHG